MTRPLNINAMGDIEQAVKYNSSDLGACIVNGTINKWAKWKPQSSAVIGELSLLDRQQSYWGFSVNGDDAIRFYNLDDVLDQAMVKQGDWTYIRPGTNLTDRFRMFDFLNPSNHSGSGYNANAVAPYAFTLPTNTTYTTQSVDHTVVITRQSGAELTIGDFALSGVTVSDMYYGVIFQEYYDSITHGTVQNASTTTKVSQLSAGSSINKTITFPTPGKYRGCVVALDGGSSFEDGNSVIYLPGSYFEATHARIAINVNYSLAWYQGTPSYSNGYVSLGQGFLKVTFDSNRQTSGQPYNVEFAIIADGMELRTIPYNPGESIPASGTNVIYIDLSSYPDIQIDLSSHSNAYLYTRLYSTGTNANGETANLICTNTGGSLITQIK